MQLKHYAILCAPILMAVAVNLQHAASWAEVFTTVNIGKVLYETALVLVALRTRSPVDDTHMTAIIDANDDLRKRQGSFTGTSSR